MKVRINRPFALRAALLATTVLFALPLFAQSDAPDVEFLDEKKAPAYAPEAVVTGDAPAVDIQEETQEEEATEIVMPAGSAPTDFEKRMYRIFKNSAPVSNEKWSAIVGSRRQEIYTVQAGDTLWDISQTLFGDGFFWSKLWAENGKLENPHEITPSQQIQLMSGTEANAPAVTVGQKGGAPEIPEGQLLQDVSQTVANTEGQTGEVAKVASAGNKVPLPRKFKGGPIYREQALQQLTPEELASGQNIEVDELIPAPELPPSKARKPVLKKLPPSFVTRVQPREGEYDSTGLDANAVKSMTVPATIVPNSYLSDHGVESVGKVVELEAQEKVASVGQNIFLRLDSKARIGERFSILFQKGKIDVSPTKSYGPVVEIGGRVQVIDVVNEDRNVYRAMIIQGVNPISLGSVVSRETLPTATYSRRGTRTTIGATIIGGEFDETRKMFGEGSVVYLDQGHRAGLNSGDILPIQGRRSMRREATKFPDWDHAVGLIKLVKVEDTVATGIILEARSEVLVGDRTGGRLSPNVYVPEQFTESKSE